MKTVESGTSLVVNSVFGLFRSQAARVTKKPNSARKEAIRMASEAESKGSPLSCRKPAERATRSLKRDGLPCKLVPQTIAVSRIDVDSVARTSVNRRPVYPSNAGL